MKGLPQEPKTGDRGPVMDALLEVTDAAGGLEYSRGQLGRAIIVAQEEFDAAREGMPELRETHSWGGRNTPAVYYEFCNAVAWARTVKDRYEDRLLPAIQHDAELVIRLQKIRARANAELEDARRLAQCGLHKYTPPYPLAGAKPVEGGQLIYPVPIITNPNDFRANLGNMPAGRHAASLVAGFWGAVNHLIDGLLDVFYPE
jgi:hypothetical protein